MRGDGDMDGEKKKEAARKAADEMMDRIKKAMTEESVRSFREEMEDPDARY
jgi:hypothetical protein